MTTSPDLGRGLAALHAVDCSRVREVTVDWSDFIDAQRKTAVDRQRARGLAERWVELIPAFLDAEVPGLVGSSSLLHTELMREHLLMSRGPRGWELSGLFDFEPAMVGAPEYDLASLGVFVSCGDGAFLRRTLLAYGYPAPRLDEALQRRVLAYALLHRYSNFRWYLERVPARGAGGASRAPRSGRATSRGCGSAPRRTSLLAEIASL